MKLPAYRLLTPAGLLSAVVFLVSACSIPMPQAQGDPTKFYVLASTTTSAVAASTGTMPSAIRLRAIDLASYLHSRLLIVRRGENEIEFRDFARWGEPLDQGIARVLREELLARHVAGAVQSGVARPSDVQDASFELAVKVLACEGSADGTVTFRATWQIVSTAEAGKVVARGNYQPTDLHWTPRHEATLAAGLSKAVAGLAADIAAAMPK